MWRYLFLIFFILELQAATVSVGAEQLFKPEWLTALRGKKVGLITNHTAVDNQLETTFALMKRHQKQGKYTLTALFSPEHGFYGAAHAEEKTINQKKDGIPLYSLHGETRRPTAAMLKDINLLVFDIQDLGSRSYTYLSTMCYCMEEAAKAKIPFMVLDRPNPINGEVIDGPLLNENLRSFVGYLNIPYCHGMTIGELAHFFNDEYKVKCQLSVVPMKGWKRSMTFDDTDLPWIPTSPYIPESSTALYYPTTGIIGELSIVNMGVGYTLPFKLIGAPWINAQHFAKKLNEQNFPGIHFQPFYYRPFYGLYAKKDCEGVFLRITDPLKYKPVATQYLIIGILQSLYPKAFKEGLIKLKNRQEMFNKVNGTSEVYRLMTQEKNIVWKLRQLDEEKRKGFAIKRKKYLNPRYS